MGLMVKVCASINQDYEPVCLNKKDNVRYKYFFFWQEDVIICILIKSKTICQLL